MRTVRREEASLTVGIRPDGTHTCPDALCDTRALEAALAAYGPVGIGEVTTLVLVDGWRRVHVTPLEGLDRREVLRACGRVGRVASGHVVDTIHLADHPPSTDAAVLGYRLGANEVLTLSISSAGAEVVSELVLWARELVNRPPNLKAPNVVAGEVTALDAPDLNVTVMDRKALMEAGCGGVLAVAAGSSSEPVMLDVSYAPASPVFRLALVGKGVVFDSGGLSIKSADEMYRMKDDIAGAAAVLAAVVGIARLEIPVAVRAFVPLVENVIGPAAMRPGDVIETASGITVEVVSTDAEGRLILADALSLAAQGSPDLVVDLASLTHAAETALGPNIAAVFSDPASESDALVDAGRRVGEAFWPLPLDHRLARALESEVADLKNAAPGAPGGAISAAVFLSRFIDGTPWLHVDLGGTIWRDEHESHLTKGATGFGVTTLISLAQVVAAKG